MKNTLLLIFAALALMIGNPSALSDPSKQGPHYDNASNLHGPQTRPRD